MEKKFTQTELKQALADHFASEKKNVEKITFNTRIDNTGVPVFDGTITKMTDGQVENWDIHDTTVMLASYFIENGQSMEGIKYNMGTRTVGDKTVPVFKGCTAEVQEMDDDMKQAAEEEQKKAPKPKAKPITLLADMRRDEIAVGIAENGLADRDVLEAVRAHFESHPTLPGEKSLKNTVNGLLEQDGDIQMEQSQREEIIRQYADTRMRETKMESIGNDFSPADLKAERIDQFGEDSVVSVHKVDVELQKLDATGSDPFVYVLAERADGKHDTLGRLPDKFLTNNPMNVDSCKAELQIADYSNGKMKNVSMRVVADTDLMSGDVIDLDNDMLSGLNQEDSLAQ